MNKLPCDVSRCDGIKCDLSKYCLRYTADKGNCVQFSMFGSKWCIDNKNFEFISNEKRMND